MKKKILFLCFISIATFAKAQIDSALAAQLQNTLNTQVSTGGNHGVSAHLIFDNGQTWSGTAGVDGQSMPITDSTVFITASISKLNIAILLLMLQEDGLVDLDDTWHKYLPNLNTTIDTNITIRQLLNHTSGIADYLEVPANWHYVTSNFSTFYTPQYIMENIVSGVPNFPAGTNFSYSNSNYCLAAYVAEAATPNSLATELRTRIWNPVGMKHTYFGAYEPIPDPRAGVWWNFGSGVINYSNQSDTSMLSFGYGTDNVVTCPTDLAKLVHALLNNQVLNPQSMNEMLTFVPQSFSNLHWVAGYGLGIHHLLGQTVDTVLGHDGKFCNLSDAFHSQKCGFTMATMTNTETLWEGIYNAMYDVIRNYYQCNNVPNANFYSSTRTACPGTIITFIDSSTNVHPTSWNWSFPGGTLTNGTTATDSMPQVIYNTPGTYTVSLSVSTSAGSDSINKNSYITIYSNVAAHNTAFVESFETATLPGSDWSVTNSWGIDWTVTSLGAATGSKSVYIDNFSNTPGNKSSIMSTSFDLSGFSSPKLTFKLAYQQKVLTNADKLQVFTSTNCGATWVLRLTKLGSVLATVTPPSSLPLSPTAGQFTVNTVNISNVNGSANVRFKFEFTADPAGPGNNIFIDDINIFDAVVGIETTEAQIGLEIYPNPASAKVSITSSHVIEEINIKDVLGRLIYQVRPNDKNISFVIGQEGFYFVNVRSGPQTIKRKLIVKH